MFSRQKNPDNNPNRRNGGLPRNEEKSTPLRKMSNDEALEILAIRNISDEKAAWNLLDGQFVRQLEQLLDKRGFVIDSFMHISETAIGFDLMPKDPVRVARNLSSVYLEIHSSAKGVSKIMTEVTLGNDSSVTNLRSWENKLRHLGPTKAFEMNPKLAREAHIKQTFAVSDDSCMDAIEKLFAVLIT